MATTGPEAGARGTARRSRKKSNNNRRNRPDVASDTIERPVPPQYHATAPDLIRDLTPMFGQIPVNPAPINFSRYRKNSTEAVNMDPKYKGPALAAARRSTASLVENHGSRSVQGTESSASFINQPQASSSRAIFSFPRNRTRSIGHSDVQNHRPSTPHVARSPLPFVRNPPEPAKGSAPFWRNRKRSTGRGDAMKNNPPSQPSSPFMGNPQASRGVFPYPRNRKPSTDTGDAKKNNPPLQSSSSFLGDRQASRSIFPYLNHRKVSSGAGDAIKNSPPSQSSSSRAGNTPQASKGVFQLPRNRKRSVDAGSAIKNNPQFATATQSSSPSIANPDASRVISPNTGNRKQSTGPRGAIANNLPYSTAQSWSFVRNSPGASRGTFPVPTGAADAVKIDPPFPANQAAMESCFSLAEAGAVKRVKKLSFKFPFTRNRNRSATTGESPDQQLGSKQTAKESSASLAESASQGPSTIVNFFRDRTRKQSTGNDDSNRPASGSSPAPLLGKDIPISNPSRSVGNPRLIQEQQHAQKRAKLEADTNSPPGRAGKSPASPTKPVGRLQLPRLEPRHVAAVVPSQPSPSVSSRPLIPRAQIAKRVASNDVPLCISTTMPPDDTAEPSSSTCVERTFTQELSAGSATHDKIYTHSSFTDLPELMAPHMESKSVVAPPKKRKSAPKGLFLKPFVSTIAFPTSRDEEIQVDTTAVDEEFNLTADSKYSIYKNLLDVLWTEAKSQNNLQIQQEIIQCSKSRNISASSPDFAILVSALDSQRHLLQIASALSLDEDVKIRALGNDRKKIKAYLIASQTTILDAAQEAHCLLDLVQHVLDNTQENTGTTIDTTLHRLIVKLSFSCGKLPSSLCIEGVEQTGQRPVAAGGFADIYKAVYRSNNVALKKLRLYQISTDQTTQKIREKFCQEALLWKNLKHPFIVPLIGLVSNESELNERDSEPLSMAMVCPWMPNGTIIQYLKSGQSPKVDVFLPEIAQGLCYLHSQTLVHGDLRGNHILVDEEGHARLTDFGLASFADATAKSSSRAGSGRWMAPELLDPEPHQFRRTPATDVYAFACVCYELYNGAPPFSEIPSDGAVLLNVIAGKRPGRLAPTRIPPRIWEVIQACWCQDPKDRLSTVEIVENLEKIQEAEKLHRLAEASTSSPESLGVYKAPRSSGISHRESVNSMLSLARTPSLLVDILTPRRNSSCFNFFAGQSHLAEYERKNWRQRTRAISEFFRKGKSGDMVATERGTSEAAAGKPKRSRMLSLLPKSTPWN